MWTSERIHKELREIAKTLNQFSLIEITVVVIFTIQAIDLLNWYKGIVTVETFNGTAYWAAIGSIVALIFGSCKHINDTFNKEK